MLDTSGMATPPPRSVASAARLGLVTLFVIRSAAVLLGLMLGLRADDVDMDLMARAAPRLTG